MTGIRVVGGATPPHKFASSLPMGPQHWGASHPQLNASDRLFNMSFYMLCVSSHESMKTLVTTA